MFWKPSFTVFIMCRGRLKIFNLSDRREDGHKWMIVKSASTVLEKNCRTRMSFVYSVINSHVFFLCFKCPEPRTAVVILPCNLILDETWVSPTIMYETDSRSEYFLHDIKNLLLQNSESLVSIRIRKGLDYNIKIM